MLRDTGDKVSAEDKTAIEAAIADLKKSIEADDSEAMNRAVQALTAAQHKAAESLYRNQSAGGPGADAPPPPPGAGGPEQGSGRQDGDVIDAEVVDEEKK